MGKGARLFFLGFGWALAALGILAAVMMAVGIWFSWGNNETAEKPPAFISERENEVADRERRLEQASDTETRVPDLDETIGALFAMEKALSEAKNFDAITEFVMSGDSRRVAPEVAVLKYKFFKVYKRLLDAKDDLKESQGVYSALSKSLQDAMSCVGTSVVTGIDFDRKQAEKVWRKRMTEASLQRAYKKRLSKMEEDILGILFEFSRVSSKYNKQWAELCAARDRAYLSVHQRDWPGAANSAAAALEISPGDAESSAILAMALLETPSETGAASAQAVLDKLLSYRPDSAPAYLLRGVARVRSGDVKQAAVDFEQAAAYYPKTEAGATDRLNLYKKRNFLNKSREGRIILNQYRSMTSGSGYFSPDFQQARLLMASGDTAAAMKKISDHFARRRLQNQWGHVLSDFLFCRERLGTDLHEIFSADGVELEIGDSPILNACLFTNGVDVSVHNKSARDLHNVAILLCVRFTDMFKGDYVAFAVGEPIATLKAGADIKFSRADITGPTMEDLGRKKEFKDIIEYGAVLISDEVVSWAPSVSAAAPAVQSPQSKDASDSVGKALSQILSDSSSVAVDAIASKIKSTASKAPTDELRKAASELLVQLLSQEKTAAASDPKAEELRAASDILVKLAFDKLLGPAPPPKQQEETK